MRRKGAYRIRASEGLCPQGGYDFYLCWFNVTTWNLEETIIAKVLHIVDLDHSQFRPIHPQPTSAVIGSEIWASKFRQLGPMTLHESCPDESIGHQHWITWGVRGQQDDTNHLAWSKSDKYGHHGILKTSRKHTRRSLVICPSRFKNIISDCCHSSRFAATRCFSAHAVSSSDLSLCQRRANFSRGNALQICSCQPHSIFSIAFKATLLYHRYNTRILVNLAMRSLRSSEGRGCCCINADREGSSAGLHLDGIQKTESDMFFESNHDKSWVR